MSDTKDFHISGEPNTVSPEEELLVERMLRSADKGPDLPDDLRQRWEATFTSELSGVITHKRKQQTRRIMAAAACLMLVVTALIFRANLFGPEVQVAQIQYRTGELQIDSELLPIDSQPLTDSAKEILPLTAGQILSTGANSYASIAYLGADLRINQYTQIQLYADRILLLQGSLYADTGIEDTTNADTSPTPVVISTNLGTVTHMGTQFIVALENGGLNTAVREGSISLQTDAGENYHFSASDGRAEFAEYQPGAEPRSSIGPAFDGVWDWITDAADGYQIEGANLHSFLVWASRESGRSLVYLGDARDHAVRTKLVGDVSGRSPLEALELVDSISLLNFELKDSTIEVRIQE